jgi:Fe-S-cluster-containing hydrogenase component 2
LVEPIIPDTKARNVANIRKKWISRDYLKCSGCRRCEIACSLHHEKQIWPEASRVRVFMLIPGVEIPHLCASVNEKTSAVMVDREKCTACGACIRSCPGKIPHIHPKENYVLICDLCEGDPQCVKVCTKAGYNALRVVREASSVSHSLFARTPEEITRDVAENLYGEKAEELI